MIRTLSSLACLGLAIACGYAWYTQYFRWRDCFNELGRCFDEATGVVVSEQSGAVWLALTVLALAASLGLAWHSRAYK